MRVRRWQEQPKKTLLRFLRLLPVIGSLAVLVGLLAFSLFAGQPERPAASSSTRLGSGTPVVLIVFDELPSVTLMDRSGQIDGQRFPNFYRLASSGTWYQDNVAAGDFTAWALPGILTGNRVDELTLPTFEAQPKSLFSLFGPGRRVHALERVTRLCPTSICGPGPVGETEGIDRADDFVKAMFDPFRPADIRKWIAEIPTGRGTLSFAHVELPHAPLRFLPSGQSYPGGPLALPVSPSRERWAGGEGLIASVQARHLLQVGAADRILGQILDKLEASGDFDDALVIATADHGISFTQGQARRHASLENQGSVLNPPLIIKYPGQSRGLVSHVPTQGLDILATIAAVLRAPIPRTDGQVIGKAGSDRQIKVALDNQRVMTVTRMSIRKSRTRALDAQIGRLGTGSLWQLGPRPDLVGTRPSPGNISRALFSLHLLPESINRADRRDRQVPALISGDLQQIGPGAVLALAWNGEIVATGRSFRYEDEVRFGMMVPPRVMSRNRNRVSLYRVVRDSQMVEISKGSGGLAGEGDPCFRYKEMGPGRAAADLSCPGR